MPPAASTGSPSSTPSAPQPLVQQRGAPAAPPRLLVLSVLAGAAGLLIAWSELPEWTPGVAVVLLLIFDDVLRRWSRKRERSPGEKV
ncbi:hypothetical protein GCM10010103_05530 [Streptomyces paradoxus]